MKNLILILLLAGTAYIYFTYFGEKPSELVADVTLTTDAKGKNLGIDFTTPIRYLGHFPENYGEVLQIRFRSISFSGFDHNFSIMGQIVKSGSESDTLIEDVRYEGNVPGGPFLVVKFSKPLKYTVHEGDGLKSLNVTFEAS